MKNSAYEPEKVLLTITSITFGLLVFIVYLVATSSRGMGAVELITGLVIGLFAAIAYAVIGGLVVRLYVALRAWAYRGDVIELSSKEKLRLATFWPITLMTSIVVFLFLGIINRIF